jgi:hypothetical protein
MTYDVGDIVTYLTFADRERLCKVTDRSTMNGRPIFYGFVHTGTEQGEVVWGYDSQITKVEKPLEAYRARCKRTYGPRSLPRRQGV